MVLAGDRSRGCDSARLSENPSRTLHRVARNPAKSSPVISPPPHRLHSSVDSISASISTSISGKTLAPSIAAGMDIACSFLLPSVIGSRSGVLNQKFNYRTPNWTSCTDARVVHGPRTRRKNGANACPVMSRGGDGGLFNRRRIPVWLRFQSSDSLAYIDGAGVSGTDSSESGQGPGKLNGPVDEEEEGHQLE